MELQAAVDFRNHGILSRAFSMRRFTKAQGEIQVKSLGGNFFADALFGMLSSFFMEQMLTQLPVIGYI